MNKGGLRRMRDKDVNLVI